MEILLCSLAVYKFVHLADSLSPKEAMPWVKVVFSIAVSYIAVAIAQIGDLWMAGLAVATIAGTVHTLLRLLTLVGDMAYRKSIK
jgi:hypothetical protein